MTLERQSDASQPESPAMSKVSISGARDFGMKFKPGIEEMPAASPTNHQADRVQEATQNIQGTGEPPSYQNYPASDAVTETADQEDEDKYHPYLLAWWWMLKGTGLILAATITIPLTIADAFAKLLHHTPLLYGDDTVRDWPRVNGVVSGCAAGVKYFCLGLYDGLAGWVVLPYRGAKKQGAVGVLAGILKALGATVFKATSGCVGLVSHPFFGLYKEGANLRITIKRKRAPHHKETSPV